MLKTLGPNERQASPWGHFILGLLRRYYNPEDLPPPFGNQQFDLLLSLRDSETVYLSPQSPA